MKYDKMKSPTVWQTVQFFFIKKIEGNNSFIKKSAKKNFVFLKIPQKKHLKIPHFRRKIPLFRVILRYFRKKNSAK